MYAMAQSSGVAPRCDSRPLDGSMLKLDAAKGGLRSAAIEEPVVGADRHRQAGRRRQVRARHRRALDQAQRAAFGIHFESEDFLALGIRDIRNRPRHAFLRTADDARRTVRGRL
jgi:hypothetical protein